MKTRRDIFGGLMLAAAALVCLTGCKKDDEGEKITLGVDFEQTAGMQKTYVGNGDRTIYWNVGDEVNINGTPCEVHDGAVEVKLANSYYAVYPATEKNSVSETGGEVVIPATQNYTEKDGHQVLGGPMAARLDSKTGRLLFRNLYAVIKVTVKAKETEAFTLNSITVESTNDLAGTQEFSFNDKPTNTAAPTLGNLTEGSGSKSVMLTDIDSTIPASGSASFYLYTVPFSGANLTVKINGNMIDNPTTARDDVTVPRSCLGYTAVDVNTLEMEIGIGRFKVGENKYVTFSPGNLQYQASGNGTWRFAAHQYDYIGNDKGNTTASDRDKQSDWIDLFGWGTSGWNNGNKCYQPYDHSKATSGEYASSKGYGYGPTNGTSYTFNLTGTYENSDWGVYNEIQSFDGNTIYPKGTWRTLTNAEWKYLLEERTNAANLYKASVTVCDKSNCLIIAPDGFTGTIDASYDASAWSAAEAAGLVCLPAAGSRNGTSVSNAGSNGSYWLSTYYDSGEACSLFFSKGKVSSRGHNYRYYGQSVRLVKEVE